MKIDLEQLIFKNVGSYGNNLTTITPESGLNLIIGKNGNGKSTMLSALSFNWFGKPYSEIKINELINRKNKKNLYTETHSTINGKKIVIIRGLKPDVIKILEDGKELDLKSHKSLIQDEINKILGFNHALFKQIIALNSDNSASFLSLDPKDKREISESIFNIRCFSKMLEAIKKEINADSQDVKLVRTEKDGLKTTIQANLDAIANLTKVKESFDTDKKTTLDRLNLDVEAKEKDKTTEESNFLKIEDEIKLIPSQKDKEEDIATSDKELKTSREKLSVLTNDRSNIENHRWDANNLPEEWLICSNLAKDLSNKRLLLESSTVNPFLVEKEPNLQKLKDELRELKDKETTSKTNNEFWKSVKANIGLFPFHEYEDLKSIDDEMKINRSKLVAEKLKLMTLETNKVGNCPHCFLPITEEHLEKETARLKSIISDLEKDIDEKRLSLQTSMKDIIDAKLIDAKKTFDDIILGLIQNSIREAAVISDCTTRWTIEKQRQLKELTDNFDIESKKVKDIEGVYVEQKLKEFDAKISELKLSIDGNDSKLGELKKELQAIQSKTSDLNLRKSLCVDKLKFIGESLDKIRLQLKTENEKVFDSKPLNDTIVSNEKLISRGKELQARQKTLEMNIAIGEKIKIVLDKDGIKTYFFNRLIPRLNQIISEYLDTFQLPIIFKFDSEFNDTIHDVSGEEISFNTLSKGEKHRLNLSIALGFIKINKIINDFGINIILFDETIDAGLDMDGMSLVLESLKQMVDKDKLSAYLISHMNIADSISIDRVINITKKNGFSEIKSA